MDAFSSDDLVHWQKHPHVLDVKDVSWAAYALWAPSAIEKDGKHYLFFGANDVHAEELGGIGVAVADYPEGPFRDALGHPLIGDIHNGAQPIDQMVFRDDDGQYYMYYGGWKHCNVVKLAPDLKSVKLSFGKRFLKLRGMPRATSSTLRPHWRSTAPMVIPLPRTSSANSRAFWYPQMAFSDLYLDGSLMKISYRARNDISGCVCPMLAATCCICGAGAADCAGADASDGSDTGAPMLI